MNKDINIVLTGADGAATAFDVVGGLSTITKASSGSTYSFPWKKVNGAGGILGAAEVAAQVTVDVTGSVAGDEYFFYLTQSIDGEIKQQRISVLGQSTDQLTSDAIVSAIETIAGAGGGSLLKASADNAGGTVTLVTIDSDAGYPLLSISNASSGVLTLATVTPGEAAINAGADLAALGVTDSFDGEVPSAALYNLYDLHLMLPKGHGGINGQTSDQEVDLKLYVEAGSAVEARIANAFAGLNPITGVGSDELLGQNA
jgi:hypothetical protein